MGVATESKKPVRIATFHYIHLTVLLIIKIRLQGGNVFTLTLRRNINAFSEPLKVFFFFLTNQDFRFSLARVS